MKLTDSLWIDKWSKDRFCRAVSPPAADELGFGRLGVPGEPKTSLWCAGLSEAMGPAFREGMIITDYGCGKGRYCNFLTGWLKDFRYCGLEPSNGYGPRNIAAARRLLGETERWHFDFLDGVAKPQSPRSCDVWSQSEVFLLGSVLTHLPERRFRAILDALLLSVRSGVIVFSVFLGKKYGFGKPDFYGDGETYGWVNYEKRFVDGYFQHRGVCAEKVDEFRPNDKYLHHIYRVTLGGRQ